MRDMPGMGAGGVDDFGAAHLALLGLDRRDRAGAEHDPGHPDVGGEAHAGGARVLAVRHGEIVGLEVAVAGTPEDRLGPVGHEARPARLAAAWSSSSTASPALRAVAQRRPNSSTRASESAMRRLPT